MNERLKRQADWLARYLAPLKGATIAEVEVFVEGHEAWPRLLVEVPGEREPVKLEVSRDEEGNGPGFLHGLASPTWTLEESPPGVEPGFYALGGGLRVGPFPGKAPAQARVDEENAKKPDVKILEERSPS